MIVSVLGHNAWAASKQDYDKAVAALDVKLAPLRATMKQLDWPADTPAAIGKLLHGDPQACAAFIRRSARFEPYRGILRGPQGTLDAGGGNSADLALLLRQIIHEGDPSLQLRFAVGEISEQQAAALVDAAIAAPPARPTIAASKDAAARINRVEVTGNGATDANQDLWKALADAQADLSQISAVWKPQPNSAARTQAIADARQHVWVQVQKDGKWLTLDPINCAPISAEAAQTMDDLPADWNHRAQIAVSVERLESGKLIRESLIEQEWKLAELAGQSLDVMVLPTQLHLEAMFDQKSGAGLAEQARRFERFGVVFAVGDAPPRAGRTFDLKGRTGAPESSAPLSVGTVDPFKRVGRGTPTPPASELTAVWLTITLNSPGQPARIIERALLDRIGPAARQQSRTGIKSEWRDVNRVRMSLIQRHQILVAGGPISLQRVARDALQTILDRGILSQALAVKYQQFEAKPSDLLAKLSLPHWSADLVGLLNESVALTQAQIAGSGIAFVAEPDVFIRSDMLDQRAANQTTLRTGIDIAAINVRTIGNPEVCAQTQLVSGMWASELEGRLLRRGEAEQSFDAAQILRSAAQQKIPLETIRAADDLKKIKADADAQAIMSAQIRDGGVLLIPARPVQMAGKPAIAWWRIDRSGQPLAIGADGRGQAASEGEMVLTDTSIPMVRNCMKFVACFNKAVAGGAGMNDARADYLAEEIFDEVKENLDGSIKTFVSAMHTKPPEDKPQEYNELYGKVEKAYDAYAKGMKMWDGTPAEIPGLNEGQDAANAGKEVGQSLGLRVYMMLTVGRDVAHYASGL
jgi:hypothetical protein